MMPDTHAERNRRRSAVARVKLHAPTIALRCQLGEGERAYALTRPIIASRLGVTRAIVQAWEMGRTKPTELQAERYCSIVNGWAEAMG